MSISSDSPTRRKASEQVGRTELPKIVSDNHPFAWGDYLVDQTRQRDFTGYIGVTVAVSALGTAVWVFYAVMRPLLMHLSEIIEKVSR
jgi:hypothetical protein